MFYSGITLRKSVITKAAEYERVLLQSELLASYDMYFNFNQFYFILFFVSLTGWNYKNRLEVSDFLLQTLAFISLGSACLFRFELYSCEFTYPESYSLQK